MIVTIDNPYKVSIGRPHATAEEALAELGPQLAPCVNFVPQMLVALCVDTCLDIADIARSRRISDIKKPCDRLRHIANAWAKTLSVAMDDDTIEAYNAFVNAFDRFSKTQQWIATEKLRVDALSQPCRDPDIASLAEWFLMLYREIIAFDSKMDASYGRYVNRAMRSAYKLVLSNLFSEIKAIRRLGYAMTPTLEALPAPGVIRNRAWDMAQQIGSHDFDISSFQ